MVRSRKPVLTIVVLGACLVILTWPMATALALGPSFPEMLDDAELTDVQFLDPDCGFAVGDRGVIWRTTDGGRTWRLVDVPVNSRFETIRFVDRNQGWIAGGWNHPFVDSSHATLLRTEDGGKRWNPISAITLPALMAVAFEDSRNGTVLGHASEVLGSGVFRTTDGGRSWAGVPGEAHRSWVAGALDSGRGGLLLDASGRTAFLLRNEIVANGGLPPDLRPRAISLAAQGPSWLVGDRGLVMNSSDRGRSWQQVTLHGLGAARGTLHDWRCVSVHGDQIWIAGAPGTVILHSADRGQNWEELETGQALPLNALTFLDGQRGWAVGPLGTILATRDGGRTWRAQRGGGRSAFLVIASALERIPFELFAKSACGDGFVGVLVLLESEASPRSADLTMGQRLKQAISSVGGSAAYVRQIGATDSLNEAVVAAVREQIRTWKPELIVADEGLIHHGNSAARLSQLVLTAAQSAAVEDLDPHLPAWKVRKVAIARPKSDGPVTISPTQFSPRSGRTLAELALPARGLFCRDFVPASGQSFQIFVLDLPHEIGKKDLFSGIALPPGMPGRRAALPSTQQLDDVTRNHQRQNTLRLLLERAVSQEFDPRYLTQLEPLTADLPATVGGELLFQMAARCRANGQSRAALEITQYLVDRYPDHELVDASLRWLFHHYASAEVAWRDARAAGVHRDSAVQRAGGPANAFPDSTGTPSDQVVTTAANEHVDAFAARRGLAEQWLRRLETSRPTLHFDPTVRYPTVALERQRGNLAQVEKMYGALASGHLPDAWRQLATNELWLVHRRGLPPQRMTISRNFSQRPKLDGSLDDPIWLKAAAIVRDAPHRPAATTVLFAHDDAFLFLAIQSTKSPDLTYTSAQGGRVRDVELSDADRVRLILDLDRDYATGYEFQIDHRGRTREACAGDLTWNPTWYVAQAEDDQEWRIEAAIPWEELGDPQQLRNAACFVAVRRELPESNVSADGWLWQNEGHYLILSDAVR